MEAKGAMGGMLAAMMAWDGDVGSGKHRSRQRAHACLQRADHCVKCLPCETRLTTVPGWRFLPPGSGVCFTLITCIFTSPHPIALSSLFRPSRVCHAAHANMNNMT